MSRQTVLYLAVTAVAATAAFFGGGAISQSLNDDDSTGGCKAALEKQYQDGANGEQTSRGRPPACAGADAKTLEKYVGEILAEQIGNGIAGATPTP